MKRFLSLFILSVLAVSSMSNAMNRPGAQKTYYEILGVSQDASSAEIKKAYVKLARENHPDKTSGDKVAAERFKEISTAYDVLKEEATREKYNNYLRTENRIPTGKPFNPLVGVTDYFEDSRKNANPFHDIFARSGGFNQNSQLPKCYSCKGEKTVLHICNSPWCNKEFYLCDNCVNYFTTNKKGMTCPHCPEFFIVERDEYGDVNLKKAYKCNGLDCAKMTINKLHHNPCCKIMISLCRTCSTKSDVQCPQCEKNIEIEKGWNGTINLKKALEFINCSICPNQIPKNTKYNWNPCCYNSLISLCEACISKPHMQCPSCNKNIEIESKLGSVNLKKPVAMKKCSGLFCHKQIPETTQSNYSPCCYNQMSFCGICSAKSQMQCSVCYEDIEIESKSGVINLKKPVEIKLKQCSVCPNQISDITPSNYAPCCYKIISLCGTCSTKSQIQCPNCPETIMIDRTRGFAELKKSIKCSACPNRIPNNTPHNPNPCCYGDMIFLCRTCSNKPHMECPSCNKNIDVEFKYG